MKRSKLVLSICASVFCLALLVGGIWAAVTTSFSMNTTLVFKPEGVFVDIWGQIYRGPSYTELKPLPADELGEYTIHRNYEIDEATGKPTGNLPIDTWELDEVLFLPLEKVIQFRVWVTNQGEKQITVIPMNDVTIENATVSEEASETLAIPVGATREYRITFTAGDQKIDKALFEQAFEIANTEDIQTPEEYFTMNTTTPTQLDSINANYTTGKYGKRIVVVPSTVGGNKVLKMYNPGDPTTNDWCFRNLGDSTRYVVLPNSLSKVAGFSFYGKSITAIAITSEITGIEYYAFAGTRISSITIPQSVEKIDSFAFFSCTSLTSITIPSSVTSISSSAFSNCTSLKYIKMNGNTLSSAYTLPTIEGKVWVTSPSASKPTDWTNNVVTAIPTSAGDLYYHQQAAYGE